MKIRAKLVDAGEHATVTFVEKGERVDFEVELVEYGEDLRIRKVPEGGVFKVRPATPALLPKVNSLITYTYNAKNKTVIPDLNEMRVYRPLIK